MSEHTPASPAGWYADPQNPGQQRYWDGAAWSDAVAPAPMPAVAPATSTNAIVGFVLSILSWILCPIIPAIIALFLARSSDREIAASGGRVGGSTLNTATRVISWINIVVMALGGVVFAILFVLGIGIFSQVAASLDPAVNARTGLADGQYVMNPERVAQINEACNFGGPVYAPDQTMVKDTSVYGQGVSQCGDFVQVTAVYFEVRGGVATIVRVEGE